MRPWRALGHGYVEAGGGVEWRFKHRRSVARPGEGTQGASGARRWIRGTGGYGIGGRFLARGRPIAVSISYEQDPAGHGDDRGGRDQHAEREQEHRLSIHRGRGDRKGTFEAFEQ